MAWKYKYDSLSQFVVDYQTATGIWTEYGRIDSVQITPFTNPANDGYVIMFAIQPGSKIKNLNRFSFSLTQFLNLNFSKEIPGVNVYLSEDPTNRTVSTWDILTQSQKDYYQVTAIRLIADNYLRVYWPPEPLQPSIPTLQVRIGNTYLSPGATYSLNKFLGEEETITVYIKNIGQLALTVNQNPALSDLTYYDITRQVTSSSLSVNQQDYLDIRFYSNIIGIKNTTVTIRTNDPVVPIFSFILSVNVDIRTSDYAPQISLTTTSDLSKVENGNSLSYVDFLIQTTVTYNSIDTIILKDQDSNEIIRFNNPNASGGTTTYQWVPGTELSTDTTVAAFVIDVDNNQNYDTYEINFMDRIYWGYSSSGSVSNSDILLFDSVLQEVASGTYNFGTNQLASSGTASYLYFAYPKILGVIDYVDDLDNGFTYTQNSFNINEIAFTNQFNYSTLYKVYRTNNKTFASDISWRVTFK
jgi:hypothetical protein